MRRGKENGEGPGLFDQAGPPAVSEPPRFTVGQLTAEIRGRIEDIGRLRVEGELSHIRRPASGHVYFDLKDENARLSCVVWRSQAGRALRFQPEEGMQVVATGSLDVYPPRGTYSLVVDRLEPLGIGALLAQLEKLKAELRGLGWFDRHRPLPPLPRCVGVVTSRDGAALRDLLRTRSMRWPAYPVRLCHTPVQGPGAAFEIADAIDRLAATGVDVLVVCRGGGSLEDLWAFNERPVAEAVWRCSVPVISGVGHESDTTLVDLVADHRAHTPTDAAQTVFPDRAALVGELARWGNYLIEAVDRLVARREEELGRLARRPVLKSAEWILGHRVERLGFRGRDLVSRMQERLRAPGDRLRSLHVRLERRSPRRELERRFERLRAAGQRLEANRGRAAERAEARLAVLARTLESTSPLAVLGRGYSLTRRHGETTPILDASSLARDDVIQTLLAHGSVLAQVLETHEPIEKE